MSTTPRHTTKRARVLLGALCALLAMTGTLLLVLAALDWAGYSHFLLSLPSR